MSNSPINPENPGITTAVEVVMRSTKGWERGSILYFSMIKQWTGFDKFHPNWSGFKQRLKNRFRRERGIELFWFHDTPDGWKLPTIEETIKVIPFIRSKRAARQAFFTVRALRAIHPSKMSISQQAYLAIQESNARELMRHARRNKQVSVSESQPARTYYAMKPAGAK